MLDSFVLKWKVALLSSAWPTDDGIAATLVSISRYHELMQMGSYFTTTIAYNFFNDLLLYLHFRYNVDDIDEFTSVDLVSQKNKLFFFRGQVDKHFATCILGTFTLRILDIQHVLSCFGVARFWPL